MIVVSNTTPLIGLAVIGRFDLLRQLFDKLYIPQAVYEEAVVTGREQGGAKQEVSTNAGCGRAPYGCGLGLAVVIKPV